MTNDTRDMRDPATLGRMLQKRRGASILKRADHLDRKRETVPTYLEANPHEVNPNVRPPALRQHLITVDADGKAVRDPLADIA